MEKHCREVHIRRERGLRVSTDEDVGALPVIGERVVDMKKPPDNSWGLLVHLIKK